MMQPKKSEAVHNFHFVFPADINPNGTMFGGKLLALMDETAGIAASRYSGTRIVIASTDAITFMAPLHVGDRIETIARVVWTGYSSMAVKIDVFGEEPLQGSRKHCTTTHFIMIAIDENHKPVPVPPVLIETEDDRRCHAFAERLKSNVLAHRKKLEQPL